MKYGVAEPTVELQQHKVIILSLKISTCLGFVNRKQKAIRT
jgi:hypothetical protein